MSLANLAKTAATLANLAKSAVVGFILKEDGFYLLLETGDRIILDDSNLITNLTKTVA